MMKRAWAMFLIGMWTGGTLLVFVVATQNFRTVDRLLAGSPNLTFAAQADGLGRPAARDLLRYLSAELNRLYFRLWTFAQVPLGLAVLWLIRREPNLRNARRAVAVMLVIAGVMALWLTPEITALGRRLDFVARDPRPPGYERFWILHGAYTLLDGAKLVIGLIASFWIGRSDLPR